MEVVEREKVEDCSCWTGNSLRRSGESGLEAVFYKLLRSSGVRVLLLMNCRCNMGASEDGALLHLNPNVVSDWFRMYVLMFVFVDSLMVPGRRVGRLVSRRCCRRCRWH